MEKPNLVTKYFYSELPKNQILKIIKNPHTLGYFIDIKSIHEISKEDYQTNNFPCYSYKFRREISGLLTENLIDSEKYRNDFDTKTELYETLDQVPYIANYTDRQQGATTNVHWGQLKLFLSTMQFLTKYLEYGKITNVVYAGAAPGFNISVLSRLFVNVRWYLIDPNFSDSVEYQDRSLRQNKNVRLVDPSYFDNDKARELKLKMDPNIPLYFISDVRVNNEEDNVYNDNIRQKGWMEVLQPDISQLKFRIPRNQKVADNDFKYEYLDGKVYIQMYPQEVTTESRLVVKKNAPLKIYDMKEYEGKFFYFNRILRPSIYKIEKRIHKGYIDHCHDCCLMQRTLSDYLKKYKPTEEPEYINKFFEFIENKLLMNEKVQNTLLISTSNIRRGLKICDSTVEPKKFVKKNQKKKSNHKIEPKEKKINKFSASSENNFYFRS
jgi:hypothetical protein